MMFGKLFKNKFNLNLFFLFLFLVTLDQITKALVINFFDLYESVSLFPIINLTFVVNYGFAFGLLNDPSLNQIVVSIVILLIIILERIHLQEMLGIMMQTMKIHKLD